MRIQLSNSIQESFAAVRLPRGKNPIRLGSSEGTDVVLGTHLVPDLAAEIFNDGDGNGWKFRPMCEGWLSNEEPLRSGQLVLLQGHQTLQIFHFALDISLDELESVRGDVLHRELLDRSCADIIRDLHLSLTRHLRESGEDSGTKDNLTDEFVLRIEELIGAFADDHPELPNRNGSSTEFADQFAFSFFRSAALHRIVDRYDRDDAPQTEQYGGMWSRLRSTDRDREKHVQKMLQATVERLNLKPEDDLSVQVGKLENSVRQIWECLFDAVPIDTIRYMYLAQVRKEIKDIMFGLGPLEDLLVDPSVKEIMVNDANQIYIEKGNSIENSGRRFVKPVMDIIQRIVRDVERDVNTSEPMVDARLPDGSRVNAIIKPLTIGGPCLTIRRFPQRPITINELVRMKSLTPASCEFLQAVVRQRCNILVAGGTGTGKTTLLNALSEFIPDKERIITIEDTAELRLQKTHVVSLETKQANLQGKGAVDIRMLVKNSLRMRPDRIIVGECRGGEALDMLQAMNTGHDGSMTTIHANSPEDVVARLAVMVQQSAMSSLPVASIHQQIASALDIIVQLKAESRPDPLRPGEFRRHRVVSMISEVAGLDPETGDLYIKPIFQRSHDSPLMPTGFLPTFIEELVNTRRLKLELLMPTDVAGAVG